MGFISARTAVSASKLGALDRRRLPRPERQTFLDLLERVDEHWARCRIRQRPPKSAQDGLMASLQ